MAKCHKKFCRIAKWLSSKRITFKTVGIRYKKVKKKTKLKNDGYVKHQFIKINTA